MMIVIATERLGQDLSNNTSRLHLSSDYFCHYDALIDEERLHQPFGLLVSMSMLLETVGGFNYSGADCMAWMQATGFHHTSVEHLVGPYSMVVGIK